MKLLVLGYNSIISPLNRIKKAFELLGHEIVDENQRPDVIIELCGFFDKALRIAEKYPKAIKFFNLLDAGGPESLDWPTEKARNQALKADIFTSISQTSANEIYEKIGVMPKVIYYPCNDIKRNPNIEKNIDLLWVGRLFNKYKNFELAYQVARSMNKKLYVVGEDKVGINDHIIHLGLVPPQELNNIYNRSKILLCLSNWEGLGLSCWEAILANCIPILNKQNKCIKEFVSLESFSVNPHVYDACHLINNFLSGGSESNFICESLHREAREKFSVQSFCQRIIDLIENHLIKNLE